MTRKDIKKCANALYLIGDIKQALIYLEALVDAGEITDSDVDRILEFVTRADETITYGELQELRARF